MSIDIAFLWHFHQPFYYDLEEEIFHLSWVRLHALRSYYALGKYLENDPTVKMNFNFTPSLIESIERYREGRYDYLFILNRKSVSELSPEEKLYIIKNSFFGYYPTTIKPYKRYRELYIKKMEKEFSDRALIQGFSNQDIIDLIVLSNIAWFSEYSKENDGYLKYLIKKSRNFSEYEKESLLEKELQILNRLLSLYKTLQDKGQIEITVTPYAHPIVPLISDNYSAKISLPDHPLPSYRFSYPQDIEIHIKRAIGIYYDAFGRFPSGMWPSEGAVGHFILPHFWENGIKWIATDSEILGMTKDIFLSYDEDGVTNNPELLYKPYILKQGIPKLFIVFRDHALSDLFGFVYPGMDEEEAIEDFDFKLRKIEEKLKKIGKRDYLITIILDGENPWEYYEKAKCDRFFQSLISYLSTHKTIKSTRISDFLSKQIELDFLPHLFTGSWIGHNLRTWIGDKEKNLAWEYLHRVRKDLEGENVSSSAFRSLLYAEGSDWFWWYGEGHESPEEDKLDYLFRKHLKNAYTLSQRKYPPFLDEPVIKVKSKNIPKSQFTPVINGVEDSPLEWSLAGVYKISKGAMSDLNVRYPFRALFYGNDTLNLYIRLDLENDCCNNIEVILNDKIYNYNLDLNTGDTPFAYKDIFEVGIPLEDNIEKEAKIRFVFRKEEKEFSFPPDYYITIPIK